MSSTSTTEGLCPTAVHTELDTTYLSPEELRLLELHLLHPLEPHLLPEPVATLQ